MPIVRAENPGMAQPDVMKEVAERWNQHKLLAQNNKAGSPRSGSPRSVSDALADQMQQLAV